MDPTPQEVAQAVKDATSPEAEPPVPRDLRSQTINPVHMAFRRALLPVLMENTKAIRPVKKAEVVVKPEHQQFITLVKENWSTGAIGLALAIVYDHMTGSPAGTGAALMKGRKSSNIFAPLTVCVPTKKNASSYMLNMPHVIYRVDKGAVQCVYTDGMANGGWMDVEAARCVPATDDEIFAAVESLTASQLADMMVHEYFRPILHVVMGISTDGDDDESDEPTV